MEFERMEKLLGKKWSEVSKEDKEELLAEASVNSAIDSNPVKSGEEGIVDLVYPLSINGKRSLDGENVKGGDIWGISNITSDDMEKYNLNKTAEVQHDDRTIK